MPTEARMETSAAGITTPYTPKTQKNQKSKENGAEPGGDDKTASDVSDAEIDESTLKAGTEHNADPEGKEEEDDNSLVVFHCWLCSVEFIDKVSIIRHLKEWHKDRPEVHNLDRLMKVPLCMECGIQGPCEHQDGERHEEDEGATAYMCRPRFLTCSSCPEQFLNAEAVRLHRAKEHPDEPSHQCTYCPEAFFDHPSLVSHNRIHLGGRPYICTTCGNRFSKISDLKRHERIHSGEKPFKCMQCHQTFTQKSSLEKHARIHARRSGHLACLLCGLLFKEKEALTEHAQEMHKGNNFQCGTCGKMYTEERYLILHEKTHDSDNLKPFACNYCDRRFTLQHLLTKHEKKMHLSKREIKCHLCHKTFKRNENLTRHMLSHSGVKNFQCSECGVGFTEKGSLTRHFKAQHQQLRPHSCPICRRAFTRKSLVRKHVERFHVQKARELVSQRGKFFRCRLCLKLLRKTGKRQHERHHRSKGDVWEGSLEEKIDDDIGGDNNDLDSLLGPDVAKLLAKKKGADDNDGGDVAEEEEEENDEDETAEDKNEDEDEEEENEEDADDKASSNEDDNEKLHEEEDKQQQPEKMEIERGRHLDGPVFPEFKQIEANDSYWQKSEANNGFSGQHDMKEDGELSNYRKVGVVESSQTRHVRGKRRSAVEQAQYEVNSNLRFREEEGQIEQGELSQYHRGEIISGCSDNVNADETSSAYLTQRLLSKSGNQETQMGSQKMIHERTAPLSDSHSHYSSRREDPPSMAQDLRLQHGFRNTRESQPSDPAMFESRNREERSSSSHHPPEEGVNSYSGSRQRGSKDLHYMDETSAMMRSGSQRCIGNPQYSDQNAVGEHGYQEALNSYPRINQSGHGNVAGSHYREPHQGDLKESGGYARHQRVEGEARSRNQTESQEERAYREAASAYNMVDLRQRGQGNQGSAATANLDDTRYREAAAAYAMMGIAGYTDPRMVGSRSHGQNYLGMYPWYNETALTQAMMESRPPLQGMMGNLGYPGSSGFVDPRLREHHRGGAREDQQFARGMDELETNQVYTRENAYSQEMMSALARQREYESMGHQRYRTQGDLLEQQYKAHRDASREARFAAGSQNHGMMRSGHQEEASSRDEHGYGGPGSSSHVQGSGIHRSWM